MFFSIFWDPYGWYDPVAHGGSGLSARLFGSERAAARCIAPRLPRFVWVGPKCLPTGCVPTHVYRQQSVSVIASEIGFALDLPE